MLVLFGVLTARIGYLQVTDHERYSTLSENNRIRVVPVAPTRGLIHDRNGVLLAGNRPAYRLIVIPEQVSDLEATLDALDAVVELRPTELERFHELRRQRRRFQEIPLKLQLTENEAARLAVNRHRFPGVEAKAYLTRHYPLGPVAVPAVGHVGRISEQELRQVGPGQYQAASHIGKTGVERFYEEALRGKASVERVETNALGRVLRTLESDPPSPGQDLYLTLDVRLQQVAQQALGEYSGAVVAIDPRNGEILAFVSQPTFDPNWFIDGIALEDYRALSSRQDDPLFNRALRGQYPPGSTVKPFMALAGLEAGIRTPEQQVDCKGWYSLPGVDHRWRDWKRHGLLDLEQAIAQSCDVYFYGLAYELGIDAIHDFLAPFGFGRRTGIDLIGERTGVLPSRQWKLRVKGEPWYHGETVITGIGQGYTLATPLQLAYATATLANRGRPIRPHLLKGSRGPKDDPTSPAISDPAAPPPITLSDPQNWNPIIEAMTEVVHGRRGTARAIGRDAPYAIAGKTGTAQVFSLAKDQQYDAEAIAEELRDHALFIAFAPAEDPRIALVVVVENGGSGSGTAAPIARHVMDAWLIESGNIALEKR
jgi:penicillin-binding protein 2